MIENKNKHLLKEIRNNADKYILLTPFLVLFMLFTVLPVMSSIVLGFSNFNLLEMPKFVGFDNYVRLFLDDSVFTIAFKNTIIFAIVTGVFGYFLSLLLAWVINEFSSGVRTFLTFLFYSPSIASNLYVIWTFIFSSDSYGLLNSLLMQLGIIKTPIAYLTDTKYMLICCIFVQIWMSFGTGFLSFIAGLQGIDKSIYEAGAIDGIRNRFQEFGLLTLPSMGPQLMFGAVMQISSSFSAGAVCIALCGNPSTDYAASTIVTHILDYGNIRYEMGYASAIATVLFVFMLATNGVVNRILRRFT